MRKGEITRQHIVEKSAELFNLKGYAGSSMQDIIEATGLTKGGIYRRFAGKDEIAAAAFDYAGRILMDKFISAANQAESAIGKVMAVCEVHQDPVHAPPLAGGCPLLNTAVEADDGYPLLRNQALAAHEQFIALINGFLQEGVRKRELRTDTDTDAIASFVVSSIEGGVMSSRLARDNRHIASVLRYIRAILFTYLSDGESPSVNG